MKGEEDGPQRSKHKEPRERDKIVLVPVFLFNW